MASVNRRELRRSLKDQLGKNLDSVEEILSEADQVECQNCEDSELTITPMKDTSGNIKAKAFCKNCKSDTLIDLQVG